MKNKQSKQAASNKPPMDASADRNAERKNAPTKDAAKHSASGNRSSSRK